MTRPKQTPEQTAKIISKLTGMPLPRVAQLMQKFPIDTAPAKLADEVKKTLAADAEKQADQEIAAYTAKVNKKQQDRLKAVNGTLGDNFAWYK